MKDRLSIHIDNGQSNIYEAVSIMRNGGLPAQSGLVGITNKTRTSSESPITPQTIFNIQATGQSDVRFATLSKEKSKEIKIFVNKSYFLTLLECQNLRPLSQQYQINQDLRKVRKLSFYYSYNMNLI